ncbi:hypothetical protein OAV88_03390 [bacterium]|nr:hypothetical protein [bacterium]
MTEKDEKKKGLSLDEKIETGFKLKTEGNQFFKEKKYRKAARYLMNSSLSLPLINTVSKRYLTIHNTHHSKYVRIFLYVNGLANSDKQMAMYASAVGQKASADQEATIVKLRLDANNNLAMCYIKLKNAERAYHFSSKALELDPKNLKAKCRLAEACVMQNFKYLDKAEKLVEDILSVDAENKKARVLKKKCEKLSRALEKKMKKRFKGAFS